MSATEPVFQYEHAVWGEMIVGSKEALQSLGIAVGRPFPGELGGPARKFRLQDPRGLTTEVERVEGELYRALIKFPGREREPEQWTDFAPGVQLSRRYQDEYVGTAEALAAAGLVRIDQLPGQPGARKVKVTIFADGTVPTGAPTTHYKQASETGAKTIMRASKDTFSVRVIVDEATRELRRARDRLANEKYEARMRSLPRPGPLNTAQPFPLRLTRGHLSLVWSAPRSANASTFAGGAA